MPKSGRLPRSASLKSRLEISNLLREGRRFSGNYFTLVWQPAEQFRYAILLSRRHGQATMRNRVKRMYREAVRMCRPHLRKNGTLVIFPRVSEAAPEFEQIKNDVSKVFQEIDGE